MKNTYKTRESLQVVSAIAISIILGGIAGGPASATPTEQVVYPTGSYPEDVENVQAAVDQGGMILLKAVSVNGELTAFDFGPPEVGVGGSVSPSLDVEIYGEGAGSNMTTIRGGFLPFLGVSQTQLKIRGIHFDRPGAAALYLAESTGAEFSENWVTNVVGLPDWWPGIAKGQAVWATTYPEDLIRGTLVIADNLIDGIDAELGYGLALASFGAEAHIERNEIRGANSAGIIVGLNTQAVWIEDNLIVPGPPRFPGYPDVPSWGNGIMAEYPSGGAFYIRNNTVDCENPVADGIFFLGSESFGEVVADSAIQGNRIIMHDSIFSAVGLYGSVFDSYVGQNRIQGSGAYPLAISAVIPGDLAISNTFAGNNIVHFESQVADVFLDVNSRDTKFRGVCRTVLDLGEGNKVVCAATAGGLREPDSWIVEARAAKQAFLEALLTLEPGAFPEMEPAGP